MAKDPRESPGVVGCFAVVVAVLVAFALYLLFGSGG
jgi:hypothetical protein